MDFNLFQKLASDDFAVTSLGQYAKTKRIAYQSAMNLIQQCVSADSLEEVNNIINCVTDFNVDANIIIGDACDSIANVARKAFELSEKYSGTEETDPTGDASTEIEVKVGSLSLNKIADVMQADLNSITCLESACEVFPLGDPNTQLNYFKDKMADTFSQNFTATSSSYQQYRSFFEKRLNATQFLQSIGSMMGLNEVQDDDEEEDILSKLQASDFNQYTGASPAGPLCFDTVNNAVSSAAKVAVVGLTGIMAGLYKCATSIFNKIKTKVVQTVSDPDDLYEIEGDGEYCENFGICFDEDMVINAYVNGLVTINQVIMAMQGTFDKWLHYDTKFFTLQVKISNGMMVDNDLHCHVQAVVKPKVLGSSLSSYLSNNFDLIDSVSGAWRGKTDTAYDVLNLLDNISSNVLYADNQSTEKNKAAGLCDALSVGSACIAQAAAVLEFDEGMNMNGSDIFTKSHALPAQVDNALFFYLATGIYGDNSNATYSDAGFGNTGGGPNILRDFARTIVTAFLTGFIYHRCDKLLNAGSYSWFPYAEEYNPPAGKWDIKTDQQNIEAFNKFGVTAVVVTIAVVAAIVIGVAAKKIARAAFFRRKSITGQLDNKMWSGQKLTKAEKRRYLRATRKLEASSIISSGLAANTSTDISISNTSSTIEAISNVSGLIS